MKRLSVALVCILIGVTCLVGCKKDDVAIEPDITLLTWNIFMGSADTDALLVTLDSTVADIYTFQECTPEAYEKAVNPFLEKHGEYKTECRKIDKKACRTPIIYDTEKLAVINSGVEVFRDSYQGSPSKSAAWCVFTDKSTDKSFIVVNMHGAVTRNKYPGYEDYTEEELAELATSWRKGNVKQVKEIIDELYEIYGNLPVMIAGDCNFAEGSEPYELMISYGLKEGKSFGKKSVHGEGLLPDPGKAIDHVFVNDGFKVVSYDMKTDDTTLLASDHCPLFFAAAFS